MRGDMAMATIDSNSFTMGRRLALAAAGVALAAMAASGPALAEYRGSEAQRQACTPDVMRLCSEFIPDVGRIVGCMKRRRAELSPSCLSAMGQGRGRSVAETSERRERRAGEVRERTERHVRHRERRHERREARAH